MRFMLVYDETTGATCVAGPEEYMRAQGSALVDRILAGEDPIFNLTCGQAPDPYQAVLARLQTDYAGWSGFKQVERWLME
jgi:hypothetical protein